MEEEKKNNPPRKEGGQRISVRPGGFMTPAVPADSAKTEGNGMKNNNNNRNRHHHGHRHGDRPQGEMQKPETKQSNAESAEQKKPERLNDRQNNRQNDRPNGNRPWQNNRQGERRNNQNERNDRPRREERPRDEQVKKPEEPQISESLKKELDSEFSLPAFGGSSDILESKKEFAHGEEEKLPEIDIANAPYLLDDIPCGSGVAPDKTVEVVGVRFRQAGKVYFFAPGNLRFRVGDTAIVDTARGPEFGDVVMINRKIAEKDVIQPLRPVLRRATAEDGKHNEENRAKESEALKICTEKIAVHKLDMKLVDAQYAFDNSKLVFFFTSEGRVDFRELVRDLAGVFHTRIELRQIGIRDESRLIGGLGMCGRPFCCATFLSDFGQISVKMAKEQGLSINTSKISGCCGRLMCCLRYECKSYEIENALTPSRDTRVQTPEGMGTVLESTPLTGMVKVKLDNTQEEAPKQFHRDALHIIGQMRKPVQKEEAEQTEEPADEGEN